MVTGPVSEQADRPPSADGAVPPEPDRCVAPIPGRSDASTLDGPDPLIIDALRRGGLLAADGQARFEPLTGGVSSDIWKVSDAGRVFCVKRALARLRVAAHWEAPPERNRHEVAWYGAVSTILPEAVPRVLYADQQAMLFAMDFLPGETHALWKTELRAGRVDVSFAAALGRCLATIHGGTAGSPDVARGFPLDDIFHSIRLEPYLEAAARQHADLAPQLLALSRRTRGLRIALIHGDVSPKNILVGPAGPVFLDAECACLGDPAFDLAFCLNHLLLKCLWNRPAASVLLRAFAAMADTYLHAVTWEPPDDLQARAATLLPGLLLARVDGKSPVEYLVRDWQREQVRRCARALLARSPRRLEAVAQAWQKEMLG